ncbi:hypothetical protein HDU76_012017, partial [Blyttiomyces sp. JEL0837]
MTGPALNVGEDDEDISLLQQVMQHQISAIGDVNIDIGSGSVLDVLNVVNMVNGSSVGFSLDGVGMGGGGIANSNVYFIGSSAESAGLLSDSINNLATHSSDRADNNNGLAFTASPTNTGSANTDTDLGAAAAAGNTQTTTTTPQPSSSASASSPLLSTAALLDSTNKQIQLHLQQFQLQHQD